MNQNETILEMVKGIIKPIIKEALAEAGTIPPPKTEKRYYTREEVCKLIHVGTTTFYRMANKGLIVTKKIGNRTLVDADELDEAIETRQVYRYKH